MSEEAHLNPVEKAWLLLGKSEQKLQELQEKLDQLQKGQNEPIAVIGVGCRFPGGANSPEEFWELLKKGFNSASEIPKERWNLNEYYDPDPEVPGKIYARQGCFLSTADRSI